LAKHTVHVISTTSYSLLELFHAWLPLPSSISQESVEAFCLAHSCSIAFALIAPKKTKN